MEELEEEQRHLDETCAAYDRAFAALTEYRDRAVSDDEYANEALEAMRKERIRVYTASSDKTAKLWDAATGSALATFTGHTRYVMRLALSPNGALLVTSSHDKTARVWDAKTGALLATLSGHAMEVEDAEFSPDGREVVTASYDGKARLWDVSQFANPGNAEAKSQP